MSALPTFRFEPELKEPDELQSPIYLVAQRNAWQELAEAQAALLVAYRTGNSRRAGPAADRLAEARRELVRLGQDVSRV